MKVFWSWQSDTPGKIGRHLVRDALTTAIQVLKDAPEIEEPPERENREALHLDHDRENVSGSPDLTATILRKIQDSVVFIADVTAVGHSQDRSKKLINSNVAIELGYALHALTDKALLMVLNEHYGGRDTLPFDLRHKAGPIIYSLSPDADKKTIEEEKRKLVQLLIIALRPYLSRASTQKDIVEQFRETRYTSNVATYFAPGEGLARVDDDTEDLLTHESTRGIYLRLIPTKRLEAPLRRSDLNSCVHQVLPLHKDLSQHLACHNNQGVISFEPLGNQSIKASTQIFLNGELWGFNAYLLSKTNNRGRVLVPSRAVEETFRRCLFNYLQFYGDVLKLEPPYQVEAGIAGTQGGFIAIPGNEYGPIHQSDLAYRVVFNDINSQLCDGYLLNLFERIFDLTGFSRPKHLYNFPPTENPGTTR